MPCQQAPSRSARTGLIFCALCRAVKLFIECILRCLHSSHNSVGSTIAIAGIAADMCRQGGWKAADEGLTFKQFCQVTVVSDYVLHGHSPPQMYPVSCKAPLLVQLLVEWACLIHSRAVVLGQLPGAVNTRLAAFAL